MLEFLDPAQICLDCPAVVVGSLFGRAANDEKEQYKMLERFGGLHEQDESKQKN